MVMAECLEVLGVVWIKTPLEQLPDGDAVVGLRRRPRAPQGELAVGVRDQIGVAGAAPPLGVVDARICIVEGTRPKLRTTRIPTRIPGPLAHQEIFRNPVFSAGVSGASKTLTQTS